MRQGQGLFATQIVPPPVSGYDPNFLANTKFDPAGAKALLDKFGYIDRDKDGWRDMPDGKPLVLKRGTSPSALERQYDELWQRNMTAIGIRIEMVTQRWPDLLKMARNGQLQMWQLANTSSTTEGYGFLGCSGPDGLANLSASSSEFDRLYDESGSCPTVRSAPGWSRTCRIVAAYAPWKVNSYRIENVVVYPWVIGYKYNPFNQHPWQYLDMDLKMPRKAVE